MKAPSIRREMEEHLSALGIYYLAFACFLFTLAVYYPGYMSFDSIYQLTGAREGVTDNWNPPMMAYIWRILDHIVPGPGGMLIVNTGLFWFSLGAIAAAVSRSTAIRAAILVFCGFLPPIFGLIGTIWKDIGTDSFLLTSLAFSLHARKRGSLGLLVWSTVFLWLAGTYRHNAFVATVPLVLMNTAIGVQLLRTRYSLRRERLWVAGGTAAICAILFTTISFINYHGVEDSQLWRETMIHDLVGMSVYQNVNLLPDELTRKSNITLDDLKKIYVGYHNASLFHPETRAFLGAADPSSTVIIDPHVDGRIIFKSWLAALLNHPGAYLWHRGHIADKLLVLKAGTVFGPFHNGIDPNRYGIVFSPRAINGRVMEWLRLATSTYFYSAWIYHILLLAVLAASCLLPFRHAMYMRAVAASGIIYALTNLLMAASPDFRYNLWVVSACCVSISLGVAGFGTEADRRARNQQFVSAES